MPASEMRNKDADVRSSHSFRSALSKGMKLNVPEEVSSESDVEQIVATYGVIEDTSDGQDGRRAVFGETASCSLSEQEDGFSCYVCEVIPGCHLIRTMHSSSGYQATNLERFIELNLVMSSTRGLVFDVGVGESCSALATRANDILRNQFVSFLCDNVYDVPLLIQVVSVFQFWTSMDTVASIFDAEFCPPIIIGVCMQSIGTKLNNMDWNASDQRYLSYMSQLVQSSGKFRPRPILIRQILIESCFCSDSDLEVVISSASTKEVVNQHVVQFYDDESHAIALHFPNFKDYVFQGDVLVLLRSRRTSSNLSLTYRFNTAFVDNLTTSSLSLPLGEWDMGSAETVFPQSFVAQVITGPTASTATNLVVPPYAIVTDEEERKSLVSSRHIVKLQEAAMTELKNLTRGIYDSIDLELALKLSQNDVAEAQFLLPKLASSRGVSQQRRRAAMSMPVKSVRGDASPLISGTPPGEPMALGGSKSAIEQALEDSASIRSYLSQLNNSISRRSSIDLGEFKTPFASNSPEPKRVDLEAVEMLAKFTDLKFTPPPSPLTTETTAPTQGVTRLTTAEPNVTPVILPKMVQATSTPMSMVPGPISKSTMPMVPGTLLPKPAAPGTLPKSVKAPAPGLQTSATPGTLPNSIKAISTPMPGSGTTAMATTSINAEMTGMGGSEHTTGIIAASGMAAPVVGLLKGGASEKVASLETTYSSETEHVAVFPEAPTSTVGGPMMFRKAKEATSGTSEPAAVVLAGKSKAPPLPGRPSLGKASPPSVPSRGKAPPVPSNASSASPPQLGRKSPPPPVPSLPLRKAPPAAAAESVAAAPPAVPEQLPLGRKLHWKPLRNVESTIWATFQNDEGPGARLSDFSSLKQAFEDESTGARQSVRPAAAAPTASGGPAGNPASHIVTLFEAKRAQNIGVVVARIPIEVMTAKLTSLDPESLSVENLERLKMILPTEEESVIFNSFKGEIFSLRDIEQKVIHLFRLPRLSQRIRFCLVSLQLPTTLAELQGEISLLKKCAFEIRSSAKLKKVLHIVLLLGNYVNRGETRGFSIESLSKLMEFKSASDPGITTLHFLAARLLASDPSLVDLYEEMPSLRLVSKITPESISQGVTMARNDPESIRNEVKSNSSIYSPEAVGRMQRFVNTIDPRIQGLVSEWSACEKDLAELRKFFGEDPKKISVEEFFGHLRNFFDSLGSACSELKKRPKKFERILSGGKAGPTPKATPASSPRGTSTKQPPSPKAAASTVWGKVTTADLAKPTKSTPGPAKIAKPVPASDGGGWNVIERPSSPKDVKLRPTPQ